jgi:hypothetical protein
VWLRAEKFQVVFAAVWAHLPPPEDFASGNGTCQSAPSSLLTSYFSTKQENAIIEQTVRYRQVRVKFAFLNAISNANR